MLVRLIHTAAKLSWLLQALRRQWCSQVVLWRQQEAQLPQRDSASATYTHVFLGSLTDRALELLWKNKISSSSSSFSLNTASKSLAYYFVADSMGLSSFKFVQWAPKDASFLHQSAFWPFKVVQGRVIQGGWFWYQSKVRIRLPISRSLWLWSYLAPFLRYGNLLAKNCLFFLPLSHSAPRSLCSLSNFARKLTTRKLESWGYPPVKTPWS